VRIDTAFSQPGQGYERRAYARKEQEMPEIASQDIGARVPCAWTRLSSYALRGEEGCNKWKRRRTSAHVRHNVEESKNLRIYARKGKKGCSKNIASQDIEARAPGCGRG
jgi:hypothetical protein